MDRAIRLLLAVAFEPSLSTATELADFCALNRSTAHRLLATLEYHGLVERDPESQRYRIGYGVVRIANAAEGHDALINRARIDMELLGEITGDTVALVVPRDGRLYVVSAVQPPRLIRPRVTGTALPYHATAPGKVYLAQSSPTLLDSVLSQPLAEFTETTLTDPEELRAQVELSRQRGYAISVGEFETGLNAVSATIRDSNDRIVALISLSSPSYRLSEERLHDLGPKVADTAQAIARALEAAEPSPQNQRGERSRPEQSQEA